ncbi:TRAP transporter large permease [Geoalkalibacter halelectricus]|uniref:TRAP transporter large permease n=1 Tax=Geoalkalibacter halelectricus TaxID=2847045 RepID=A0ABY5ZJX3_9BACT|nr:TRAP transporter large permease [Geoalkalibacter halelectricus]MDO3380288.1 TRAP transporter large permease [Geoalkalibacter halelectricus]UWZ79440.1 TRAP transporter large permease [Geoalkalibacter halelectricus]
MEWGLVLTVSILTLLFLFATGMPIFIAFLVVNVGGVFLLFGANGFGMFSNSLYNTVTQETLMAIPLFVLMGEILFRSDAVRILIDAIDKLVGNIRGRHYILVTALSTVFGALSGSAVAVAAMLGRSVLPTMDERGYDKRLSVSAVIGGASLAPIIPPSLLVIMVGSMVDVSIAKLLIAGILPGVLLAFMMVVYTYIRILRDSTLEPPREEVARPPVGAKELFGALAQTLPFLIVIFSVMGLIMLGVATPNESAATGVLGALIAAAIFKKLSFKMFYQSLIGTCMISAMILIIIACSMFFGQLLSFTGATTGLVTMASELGLPVLGTFFVLMFIPFVLCMFVDLFAVMLIAIPIYEPLLGVYGFDPIWFWMLFLINMTLGSMTPPFGYTIFALKGAAPDFSMEDVYGGAWPMVGLFILGMAIMYAFPGIVTFLPSFF